MRWSWSVLSQRSLSCWWSLSTRHGKTLERHRCQICFFVYPGVSISQTECSDVKLKCCVNIKYRFTMTMWKFDVFYDIWHVYDFVSLLQSAWVNLCSLSPCFSISVNSSNVQSLLNAANQYQIEPVKKMCVDFLKDQVDETNCLSKCSNDKISTVFLSCSKAKLDVMIWTERMTVCTMNQSMDMFCGFVFVVPDVVISHKY